MTTREVLNRADLNTLSDSLRKLPLGKALALLAVTVRGDVESNVLELPDNMKATAVVSAFATAATSAGAKTPVVGSPAAGEVAVNALGNIVFNGTDAVTAAEVTYLVAEGDLIEEEVIVQSNTAIIGGGRTVRLLLEAEAVAGSGLGVKTVLSRGTAAGSAGQAAATNAGSVAFNATDAVTRARIKYIAFPKKSVGEALNE